MCSHHILTALFTQSSNLSQKSRAEFLNLKKHLWRFIYLLMLSTIAVVHGHLSLVGQVAGHGHLALEAAVAALHLGANEKMKKKNNKEGVS